MKRNATTLPWSAKLATGDMEIDAQHQELIDNFNRLIAACDRGEGKDEVAVLLQFLNDYVVSHFSTEDHYIELCGCRACRDHKQQHEQFISDLIDIQNRFYDDTCNIGLIVQANQMIMNWLVQHICVTDKHLASHVRTS